MPRTTSLLHDPSRLAALRRLELLDTPADEALDRLTRLTARVLRTPVALITLVDADRQFFKSQVGLPEPWASLRETPLSHSFCRHVVENREPLVVSDARLHPLLAGNAAIHDLGVVTYLGAPLITAGGVEVGALCAIDTVPRDWTEDDVAALRELAAVVVTTLDLWVAAHIPEPLRAPDPLDALQLLVERHCDGLHALAHALTGDAAAAEEAVADAFARFREQGPRRGSERARLCVLTRECALRRAGTAHPAGRWRKLVPEDEQRVLDLAVHARLRADEIAEACGISVADVRVRLRDALHKTRAALAN